MCKEDCVQERTALGGQRVGGGSPAFRIVKAVSCSAWWELNSSPLQEDSMLLSTAPILVSFLSERKGKYRSCIHGHTTYSAFLRGS